MKKQLSLILLGCILSLITKGQSLGNSAPPTIIIQATNQIKCIGSSASFSVLASNAISYQWQENAGNGFNAIVNGSIYSGATSSSLLITGVTGVMNGNLYQCIITNGTDPVVTSETATLTVYSPNLSASSQTNILCHGNTDGSASVDPATGGAGGYYYDWTPGNPSGDGTIAVTGLAPGIWTCTVTDANSCKASKTFNITQPTQLISVVSMQVNLFCSGDTTGLAGVSASGGTGSLYYSWAPAGGTDAVATNLSAGNYTCTITDSRNCVRTETVSITQPNAIITNQSFTICAGGSVTVGTNTYNSAGTHTTTLKAMGGCDSIVLTHLAVTNINNSVSTVGTTISANEAGATYQWIDCNNSNLAINGAVNQNYVTNGTGNYAVMITKNGCSNTSACVNMNTTSIASLTNEMITVYPNPNNGTFTIKNERAGDYSIVNELGQTICTAKLSAANNFQITLEGLDKGIYFIIEKNAGSLSRQKIVVTN